MITHGADYPLSRAERIRAARRAWLRIDPRRIGLVHLGCASAMLLVAGAFALAMRLELAGPAHAIVDGATFRQLSLLSELCLLTLFALPATGALGNLLLGARIGAEGAGPLVGASGLLYGAATLALITVAALTGFAARLLVDCGVELALIAAFLQASAMVRATRSSRGTPRSRLSLAERVLRVGALAQLFALPVLMVVVAVTCNTYVRLDGPTSDSISFEHFLRAAVRPIYGLACLPALALIVEALPPALADRRITVGAGALALIGGAAWSARLMVAAGPTSDLLASFFTLAEAAPLALLALALAGPIVRGRRGAQGRFAVAALAHLAIAALTGVYLAIPDLGVRLRGTAFEAAHDGFLVAAIGFACVAGGLAAWRRLDDGSRPVPRRGLTLWLVALVAGVQLTLVPQLLAGARGLPRVIDDVPRAYRAHELVSALGAGVIALAVIGLALTWIVALKPVASDESGV